VPTLDGRFDVVVASQATFRVVLEAMARPGTLARLPAADPRCPAPTHAPLAAVLLTLIDHEVGFAVVARDGDGLAADHLARYLSEATGSRAVAPGVADYVLALGAPSPDLILGLKRGTPTYPDESATLLVAAPSLVAADGPPVALAGPGTRPGTTARLAGLTPDALAALATANAEPPLGIDVILADAAGHLVCLPRSTRPTPA
jgi:alpha-D-ribose 1-methylphosphonate 5-triphosphate synthase subunit PhnH